jgi:hypothetical protein
MDLHKTNESVDALVIWRVAILEMLRHVKDYSKMFGHGTARIIVIEVTALFCFLT